MTSGFYACCSLYCSFCANLTANPARTTQNLVESLIESLAKSVFTIGSNGATVPSYADILVAFYVSTPTLAPLSTENLF